MKNLFLFLAISLLSCSSNNDNQTESSLYFPPFNGNWETTNPNTLNWNTSNLNDLYNYLQEKGTKGFIILKDGKIVIEKYFNGHDNAAKWNWYSAGKTLTSATIGIAQSEGFLDIHDKTSDYLGLHWTSLNLDKENLITIRHQLTMTTGLDDSNFTSTNPQDLTYLADAGTRWAYHNGPYTLLQNVIANATNGSFNNYFNEKIQNKIGMTGFWYSFGDLHIYRSNTRDMARFGLLILRNGKWNDEEIIPQNYYNEMVNSSQNTNPSYGYLWWLNGKDKYMLPQSQEVHFSNLIPNAPDDLIAALGANDQKIYVIPSKNMVVVRCGEDANTGELTASNFDNVLWEKLSNVIY